MAERFNEQDLYNFAVDSLLPVGQVETYTQWYNRVRQSEHPEAVRMYHQMKKAGVVKPELIGNDDGTVTHNIYRQEV